VSAALKPSQRLTRAELIDLLLHNHLGIRFEVIGGWATSERGAAFLIGKSINRLRKLRYSGKGPPTIKVGGKVLYPLDGLSLYLAGEK
jgi:hypothetical protein